MENSPFISDFFYDLPKELIAMNPAENRDASRLLFYNKGKVTHHPFTKIGSLLPNGCSIVFNNTKVIPARLFFQKESGAIIELFLLDPVFPSEDMAVTLSSTDSCIWKCFVGNRKRWKEGKLTIHFEDITLTAEWVDRDNQTIKLSWSQLYSFAEILEKTGKIPLPPYITRDATEVDRNRYQTVYSENPGAVAAPTAGLHFTKEILEELGQSHKIHNITLHVGAGTFQPVKTEKFEDHEMHAEPFYISKDTIVSLMEKRPVVAVGTTSLRTLESLYWYGVKLCKDPNAKFIIDKSDMYSNEAIDRITALSAILTYGKFEENTIKGKTRAFIYPGYSFRLTDALITNFHLPGSTLVLLISAFIGKDWRSVYQTAIENKYRFLSYGDSSLLIPRDSLMESEQS